MFSTTVLSIAITLVFVYLVLAVMVTGINETWFAFTRQKAKRLEKFLSDYFFDDEWRKELFPQLKNSPFIQVLKKGENIFPASIPSANFARSILTIIGDGTADLETIRAKVKAKTGKGGMYQLLNSLLAQVHSIDKLQGELEGVFDSSMERVTGWYKRHAKILSFCIGLVICAGLNIDTVNITKVLWNNKDLAEKVSSGAVEISRDFEKDATGMIVFKTDSMPRDSMNVTAPARTVEKSYMVVAETGVPMGWTKENTPGCTGEPWQNIGVWLMKILGIVLTACAVTLGAPFWFDILSKVTPLKKPAGESSLPPKQTGQK